MALILAFGILALIIAVPLGAKAAYILAEYVAVNLNFNLLGERLVPFAIVIQIVIGLAIPLIAGLFPVIKGSRTTVQAAISGTGAGAPSKRKGWIDRTLEKVRFLSRPLLISLRNTFRRKSRLVLTLATLTMGGAIFIGVFNVQATLEKYIGSIGQYFLADVTLNFSEPYRVNEITREAMLIPGVEYVEGWAFASGDAIQPDGSIGETIQILAPPADSPLVDPMLVEGRWIIPGDEKAITVSESILSSFPGVQAGDTLRLKVLGQEEDWTVVGIFKFVDADNLLAYANYDYISKLMDMSNQSLSYRIVGGCHDLECQEALTARVDQHFRAAGYAVSQVQPGLATLQSASESLDILINFLLIMALLTAVVGSIGLTGTLGMNVLERTREIGVMRSIGAIDWQIIKSVLFEGIIIGSISFVLAALLSFPISSMLATIISLAIFNAPIALAFTWTGYAIWLGLVLVFSALASILPAHNASRLTIREVLAYE
jgi:putative ABC transport system permease protein